MLAFIRRRIITPIARLLLQGVAPQQIALSIAIGLIVGVFPVLGATTVLVTLSAIALRLNLIAAHATHYAATPLQLVLIIPFVRVGEHIVGATPQPLTLEEGLALIHRGIGEAVVTLWVAIVHAIIGWLALGPIAIWLIYLLTTTLLRRVPKRTLLERTQAPPPP